MPLVKVIKKILGPLIQIGGTVEVTGDIDISNGLVIELNPSVFNAAGLWTLITWGGTLTGALSKISMINNTNFGANSLYLDGNAIKVLLTPLSSITAKSGGTIQITGNVDVSGGLVVELNPSVFTSTGTWTLMTWTGSLTGTAANVSFVNNTSYGARNVVQVGNSFKIDLV